jgi:hypothetical protein
VASNRYSREMSIDMLSLQAVTGIWQARTTGARAHVDCWFLV